MPAINQFCWAITGLSKVPNYKANITLVARDQNSSNAVPEKCLHLHLCIQLVTSHLQPVQNNKISFREHHRSNIKTHQK